MHGLRASAAAQALDGYVMQLPPLQPGERMVLGQVMHPKVAALYDQVRALVSNTPPWPAKHWMGWAGKMKK
jgi:hypothetical protein